MAFLVSFVSPRLCSCIAVVEMSTLTKSEISEAAYWLWLNFAISLVNLFSIPVMSLSFCISGYFCL